MDTIMALIKKYRDIIMYGIFGVLTTLVNIVMYWVCAHPLALPTLPSNIIAWVISVLFAYYTNRTFVFQSKNTGKEAVLKEMASFFACRIGTGVMDWVIMFLFVDVLSFNDMVVKIASNFLVIVLNYAFSKLIIFKKK